MTTNGWLQIAVYFVILTALVLPLGRFMARVFSREWASRYHKNQTRFLQPNHESRMAPLRPVLPSAFRHKEAESFAMLDIASLAPAGFALCALAGRGCERL